MYEDPEYTQPEYPEVALRERHKTVFDDLPGQPSYQHYSLCSHIQDSLDDCQNVYAQHIEIELSGGGGFCPGLSMGYLEYFRDGITSRIYHAFGPEMAEKAMVRCQIMAQIYGPGVGRLHLLVLISQDAYLWLGGEDQTSGETLYEFVTDSWDEVQRSVHFHPSWITSSHKAVGGYFLSNSSKCTGVRALVNTLGLLQAS